MDSAGKMHMHITAIWGRYGEHGGKSTKVTVQHSLAPSSASAGHIHAGSRDGAILYAQDLRSEHADNAWGWDVSSW